MENFAHRSDRFEFFERFENPLLNITFKLTVPDFIGYCKANGLPTSHFFLYCLFKSLHQIENLLYRIYEGEVIKIDKLIPSYTVLNQNNVFNFTKFEYTDDRNEFIRRSLEAGEIAKNEASLINTGAELSLRELKNYIFITSLPWLEFTSIQHPVAKFKSSDIPSIAWGKFNKEGHQISMPFSVQAHHGFLDGLHIHQLAEKLSYIINAEMEN